MAVFNDEYYRLIYPEQNADVVLPIVHYAVSGWREGLNPAPDFNTNWYLAACPEALASRMSPLEHYLAEGKAKGFKTFPDIDRDTPLPETIVSQIEDAAWFAAYGAGLFDPDFYLDSNPDLANGQGALSHYRKYGWRELRNPSRIVDIPALAKELFGEEFQENPVLALAFALGAETAFKLANGSLRAEAEARGLFDAGFYCQSLSLDCPDPFAHYMLLGWRAGANPSETLNTRYYIEQYMAEPGNPILDIMAKEEEGIIAPGLPSLNDIYGLPDHLGRHVEDIIAWETLKRGFFDAEFYLANYPDLDSPEIDPWLHYRKHGYRENRSPSQKFDARWYLEQYLANDQNACAIFHFLFIGEAQGNPPRPNEAMELLKEENRVLHIQLEKLQTQLRNVPSAAAMENRLKTVSSNYKKTLEFLIEQLGIISAAQPK